MPGFGWKKRGPWWPGTHIGGDGISVIATWGGGWYIGVGGLNHSDVGGGFHERMGGPRGPRVGAVADHLIMATNFVGWAMRLLWGR